MKFFSPLVLFLCFHFGIFAQDSSALKYTYQTFKDTRIINTASVEVLPARQMDFRVSHRFGDMFGANGGWQSFYGLENAADILIGFDYGLLPNLNLSFNRTKGAGPLNRLLNSSVKYKLLSQTEGDEMPLSMALLATMSVSTMRRAGGEPSQPLLQDFGHWSHRLLYSYEVLLARKCSDIVSIQLAGTAIWRNIVERDEPNLLFALGFAGRFQVTKTLSLILDSQLPFAAKYLENPTGTYQIPIGLGLEFETGGHVFQINWTNASGLMPSDYLPHTQSRWQDGAFRLGFTISRRFRV